MAVLKFDTATGAFLKINMQHGDPSDRATWANLKFDMRHGALVTWRQGCGGVVAKLLNIS